MLLGLHSLLIVVITQNVQKTLNLAPPLTTCLGPTLTLQGPGCILLRQTRLKFFAKSQLSFIIFATSGLMYRVTEFYNFYHLDLTHGLSRLLSEIRLNEC